MTAPLYDSRPVFWFQPDFQELKPGQLDDTAYGAAGFGRSVPWRATSGPKRTIEIPYRFTRSEARDCRVFFAGRSGRRLGFWLPVWLNDYALTMDYALGESALVVNRSQLAESLVSFSQFGHLALVDGAGRMECHAIASVVSGTITETINLSSTLLAAAGPKSTQVAGLMFVRLQEDEIEFEYSSPESIATILRFAELPTEYVTAHAGTAPLYLYEFDNGAATWTYTNWGVTIVIGETTWTASSIAHGQISYGSELLSDEVELEVVTDDSTHPLRLFATPKLQAPMTVKIFETDADAPAYDPDAPIFSGRIQGVEFGENGKISVTLSSILRVGEQSVPRMMVQRTCNHRLFDVNCGKLAANYSAAGTISAITPSYVESAAFAAKLATLSPADPTWFTLGTIIVGTERRMAVNNSGSRIYIEAPFTDAEVGDAIIATSGCDLRMTTCRDRFANLDRAIAFPYLPNENPQFRALTAPAATGGKKG